MDATDGLLRSVYEGCITGCDIGIERRPYHRNCSCALHKSRSNKHCSHGVAKCTSVAYPLRRAWSDGCLALAAASSGSPHSSPSSSSLVVAKPQLEACSEV